MANDEDVQSVTDYNDSPHYVRVSLQTRCINISRPVYDQASFDRQFVGKDASTDEGGPSTPLRDRVRSLLPSCDRSTPGDICRRVVRYLPVVEHLRNYRWRSWLLGDILAGVSSGVIHVPQVSSLFVCLLFCVSSLVTIKVASIITIGCHSMSTCCQVMLLCCLPSYVITRPFVVFCCHYVISLWRNKYDDNDDDDDE